MLNQISIMGRLTLDPELKTTQAGKSVCTTSGSLSIWTSCSRKETADHDHVSM